MLSRVTAFLDILLSTEDDRVTTSVFTKPTDSHSYLMYNSFHPQHLLKSIPFSQFLRIRRLCSNDEDFHKQADLFAHFFRNRGYPNQLIQSAIFKAASKDRLELLSGRGQRPNNDRIPVVLTYTPLTSRLAVGIKKAFDRVLVQNPTTKCYIPFSSHPFIQETR